MKPLAICDKLETTVRLTGTSACRIRHSFEHSCAYWVWQNLDRTHQLSHLKGVWIELTGVVLGAVVREGEHEAG